MKVRRTRTLSSSRPSDISALLGGGKRHGAKTVAMLELVIKFSAHLTAAYEIKSLARDLTMCENLSEEQHPVILSHTVKGNRNKRNCSSF